MKRFKKAGSGFGLMLAAQLTGALLIGAYAAIGDVGGGYSGYAWSCALSFALIAALCWLLWYTGHCSKLDAAVHPGFVEVSPIPVLIAPPLMILLAVTFGLRSGEEIGCLAIGAILTMLPDIMGLWLGVRESARRCDI